MTKLNILLIMPESIGGRLTISSLKDGSIHNGHAVNTYDQIKEPEQKQYFLDNINTYHYLLGYDYSAVEFKVKHNLNIPIINYFSDVIDNNFSCKDWDKYYSFLKNNDNYTFYWDKNLTKESQSEIPNIYYLPHCVNTDIYTNMSIDKEDDIMFAGRIITQERLEFFSSILKNFPDIRLAIYCYKKHLDQTLEMIDPIYKDRLLKSYKGFIETEEEMAKAINQSHAVINFTQQGKGSLNYRVYQTLACETFLITDYQDEIDQLFSPPEDIIYFKNKQEFIKLIENYFANPEKYTEIIKNGKKTVNEKYCCQRATRIITDTISGIKG